MDSTSLVKMAKALGDPHRLRLLREIAQAPQVACADLFTAIPISQPAMSHHLKALIEAGLVDSHKTGRCMHLSLNAAKIQELERFLTLLNAKQPAQR